MKIKSLYAVFLLMALCGSSVAPGQTITPNVSSPASFHTYNRQVTVAANNGKTVVHINAAPGDGVAWLNNSHFSTGTIDFDVKGKDVLQQSFVGLAFHGTNDSTFDAVYFRPFNFNAADSLRRAHAVQYISRPEYDWSYLRETYPGTFENAMAGKLDPNDWFHVKLVVKEYLVEVFVNNEPTSVLSIIPMHNYTNGEVGFWVGNNSGGDFANLRITEKQN